MDELQQVNLVAVVGAGGAIGPADALPQMMYEEEARWFEEWFTGLTEDGIIILGGQSYRWLVQRGLSLGPNHMIALWSRQDESTRCPETFLRTLSTLDKPLFVCGGLRTYQTFMPFVTQFFIRRVALDGPHDNYLPPLFGRPQ